jgi:hypothetical protein
MAAGSGSSWNRNGRCSLAPTPHGVGMRDGGLVPPLAKARSPECGLAAQSGEGRYDGMPVGTVVPALAPRAFHGIAH